MLSIEEFVGSSGNFLRSIAELYQYEALVLGTIVNCHFIAQWGLKKKGK
jgi:hypothetical protein